MDYIQHLIKSGSLKGEENSEMPNQTQSQVTFRTRLWGEFVAGYQVVLATTPEKFSEYCAKFRERWVRGF